MAGEQGERRGLWNASSPRDSHRGKLVKEDSRDCPQVVVCGCVGGMSWQVPTAVPRAHARAHASQEGESADGSCPGRVDLLGRREHGEERCKPDLLRGAQNRGEAASYEKNNLKCKSNKNMSEKREKRIFLTREKSPSEKAACCDP